MARIKIISIGIVSVLLVSALTVFSLSTSKTETDTTKTSKIQGIILPHHLLVEKYIDDFYKLTAENRPDITRIILFSPNHFLYGFHYIQSTNQAFTKQGLPELDQDFIENLSKTTPLAIEPAFFEKEHGIMVELPFISEYFPNAKVVPITLKNNIPKDYLESLIKEILKSDMSNTLVISSIDFTHYEPETVAVKNDNRTIAWLKSWSAKAQKEAYTTIKNLAKSTAKYYRGAVAIDSPESFYMIIRLMEESKAKNFELWKRTSSASLLNNKDPLQNTSHLFIEFKK